MRLLMLVCFCSVLLRGASTEGMAVVEPFDAQRYMGTWYEIARLPNSFEDGMESITATYSLRDDGRVRVVNRGWDLDWQRWSSSEATARFVDDRSDRGWLQVTFFWPFSAHYKVLDLDPQYRWALVTSGDTGYLWILAREQTIPAALRTQLLATAQGLGFATDQLVWVDHSYHDQVSVERRTRSGRSRSD